LLNKEEDFPWVVEATSIPGQAGGEENLYRLRAALMV
jgi:hypothetical protein